jgi:hypothetical protein
MNSQIVLVVAVIAVISVFVVIGWWLVQGRKRRALRNRFGPEYDRTVDALGESAAEADLETRVRRVDSLEIRPVPADQRPAFEQSWRRTQTRFVDDPAAAVAEADALVGELMAARGYPVGQFDQRAADISVNHPAVVDHYRAAHAIAVRSNGGQATTEELRQAVVEYRALFGELLSANEAPPPRSNDGARPGHPAPITAPTEVLR